MARSLPERLGSAVARLRAAKGWTQDVFAAEVGIHRSYLGKFERGSIDPRATSIERIARGLGLTTSELIREAERER
jgi:transcriptional regulator with XRE-family HTH domain